MRLKSARCKPARPAGFQYTALASSTRARKAPPSAMPRLPAPRPRLLSVPPSAASAQARGATLHHSVTTHSKHERNDTIPTS
jgi:hypothetical protein